MNPIDEQLLWWKRQTYNLILPEKYQIEENHFHKMLKAKKESKQMRYLDFKRICVIIKLEKPRKIVIGCKEDWEATHATIYDNYSWIKTEHGDYWVQSIWDQPVARVYYDESENYEEEMHWTFTTAEFSEELYKGDNSEIINFYKNIQQVTINK